MVVVVCRAVEAVMPCPPAPGAVHWQE